MELAGNIKVIMEAKEMSASFRKRKDVSAPRLGGLP